MTMQNYDWTDTFRTLYDKAVKLYAAGNRDAASYFNPVETAFLAGIGHTARELYDFAEDANKHEEPSYADALLIASVRRDYFLVVLRGKPATRRIEMSDLPAKDAAVAGFEWLPRIMAKARAKLHGAMPDDLMYGCGGDRAFLRKVDIHPADFLRYIWAAGDDDQKIIDYVKQCAANK